MSLFTYPLLLLLLSLDNFQVLPGDAKFSWQTCDTTEDSLYIILDSSSNINLTFTRIKNFVQYFISKRNNSSQNPITIIEPFQQKVFRFSNYSSSQKIFAQLDLFQILVGLNNSIENNLLTLTHAFSFTNETLNRHETHREQSVMIAWFSVCYDTCKKTIRYFKEFSLLIFARQIFLFVPSLVQEKYNWEEYYSFLRTEKFIYFYLTPHVTFSNDNVIAFHICYDCPSGWIFFLNDNSISSCYKIIISPFKLNWNDASKQCQGLLSELPIIETNKELQFLKTLLNSARNDVLSGSIETFVVHVGLTKSSIGKKKLQWTNDLPFLLWKNIESKNDNNNCVILKYSIVKGIENGSFRESDQLSWEMIDCNQELTDIVLCKLGINEYLELKPSHLFGNIKHKLEKKMLPLNKEFIFKTNEGRMYSIVHREILLENRTKIKYKELLFDCVDGSENIVYSKVCNIFDDCLDASDEKNCGTLNLPTSEQKNMFCKNPNANEFYHVRNKYVNGEYCNAHQDCPDNSDEENCDECGERRCSDGTCVPRHWLSQDGDECKLYNIINGTIFINITGEFLSAPTKHEVVTCNQLGKIESVTVLTNNTEPDNWAPKCIFLRGRSGRPTGCNDLSHLHDCVDFICTEEFVKCHKSYCIPLYLINDRQMDCPHGEDEGINMLLNISCPFHCNDYKYKCIPFFQVCDGFADCPERDDELNCNVTCPPGLKCYGSAITVNKISEVMEITSFRIFDIKTKFLNLNGLDLSQLNEIYILPHLLELHASHCNLDNLEYIFSGNFEMVIIRLDLSYNKFIRVDINDKVNSHLPFLSFLNLTRNMHLYFLSGDLKSSNLDLSYTKLSLLNIEYQTYSHTLHYLNLSNTKIESLGTLYKINSLEILDIRNTMLVENDTLNLLSKLNIKSALYTDNVKFCCPQVVGKGITKHVCHATFDGISSCEDLIGDIVQRSLLWLVAIFSLLGNIMVLAFRFYYEREIMKKGYGVFVTNLGISDLVMGIYLTIIVSADIYFRDNYVLYESNWRASMLCKISGFLSTLSSESSTFFVLLITLDRFLVIRFPFGEYRLTKLVIILSVVTSWVIGFTSALLPIVYRQWTIYSSNGMCLGLPLTTHQQQGWQYAVAIFIVFNCILFLAISLGQVLIFLSMNNQRMAKNTINSSRREQDINVAKQLFIVALSNFLCWFPICVTGLLSMSGHQVSPGTYAWFVIFVLPLNAALNPLIYTIPVMYTKWREFQRAKLSKNLY